MTATRKTTLPLGIVLTGLLVFGCGEEPEATDATEQAAPPQQELEARIQELQGQLAEKEQAVTDLQNELEQVRDRMPQPRPVESGDSHWGIAKRYLTEEEGLEPSAAERELATSALLDPILEGQEVWNYYDGSIFGSFVVQDEAAVSPAGVLRAERREAREAKEARAQLRVRVAELQDELGAQQARLNGEVERLERHLRTKTGEVDSLRAYIDSLRQHQETLRADVLDLTERLSSVYYLAGTEADLRAERKVEKPFLRGVRLGELDSSDFERRIDLRESSDIRLTADDVGVPSIENVDVLPSYWKRDLDYRVNISTGGETATIELLDEEQFRLRTLVLLVNS